MSYTFKKNTAWSFLLLFLMLTSYSFSKEKIEFSIIANKNEITQFEPLIINFHLKNVGSSDWKVIGSLLIGWVRLETGEFEGKYYQYDTGTHPLVDFSEDRVLKPNQLYSGQLIIFTYKKSTLEPPYTYEKIEADPYILFPFGDPGTYKIKAFYPLEPYIEEYPGARKRKMLESNTLEIRVHPWNQKEQEAFHFFKRLQDFASALGACCPDNYNKEAENYENFLNLYPGNAYTPYIKFSLAQRYHYGRISIPGEEKDYGRASELYSDLTKSAPSLLADDAFYSLARLQIEQSRFQEAKATVEKLLKDYPLSNNIPKARRIRDGLKQGYMNLDDILSKVCPIYTIDTK